MPQLSFLISIDHIELYRMSTRPIKIAFVHKFAFQLFLSFFIARSKDAEYVGNIGFGWFNSQNFIDIF